MNPERIGILHPGAMGVSIAATALNSGHRLYWASEGRSPATHDRASRYGLLDTRTVARLCATCSILLSVCPPHAAEAVARRVLDSSFTGLYLDANAISPSRTVRMGQEMEKAGIAFVDGGIIGEPAWKPKSTRLYLAGSRAADIAACFSAGPLEAHVLGGTIGTASALKMCFAAYSKGTTALLSAVLTTAEHLGVRQQLCEEWAWREPDFPARASRRVCESAAKAWRFVGEMEEIAATFKDAGMPGDFHAAAARIYGRLARFKDSQTPPALEEVLAALLQPEKEP